MMAVARHRGLKGDLLHLPKGFRFKDISKLSQRIVTTYRLPIEIEHALPNWLLVDYKEVMFGVVQKQKSRAISEAALVP
jgi:hypothetical protein